MKIAVVTDSSSDIYDLKEAIPGIYGLPLQILSGDDTYLDGETIDRNKTFDMLEEGHLFSTSLPPLSRAEELFEQLKAEGYDLIFGINLSTGLSGTTQALNTAASNVGIDFDYFDLYSGGEILLTYAKAARVMFDKGFTVEQAKERLAEARDHSATYILPDNLKHLMKSGRLSPAASILGGLLKIKPVLYLGQETGGKLEPVSKPRTMNRAIKDVFDRFMEAGIDKDYIVYVVHVRNEEYANKLRDMIVEKVDGVEIYVKELVTAVAIHVGLGGLASQYTKKINVDWLRLKSWS